MVVRTALGRLGLTMRLVSVAFILHVPANVATYVALSSGRFTEIAPITSYLMNFMPVPMVLILTTFLGFGLMAWVVSSSLSETSRELREVCVFASLVAFSCAIDSIHDVSLLAAYGF